MGGWQGSAAALHVILGTSWHDALVAPWAEWQAQNARHPCHLPPCCCRSFVLAFRSPVDAVRFGLRAQEAMMVGPWGEACLQHTVWAAHCNMQPAAHCPHYRSFHVCLHGLPGCRRCPGQMSCWSTPVQPWCGWLRPRRRSAVRWSQPLPGALDRQLAWHQASPAEVYLVTNVGGTTAVCCT